MNIFGKDGSMVVTFDNEMTFDEISQNKREIDNTYKISGASNLVFDYSKSKNVTDDDVNFALGRYKHVLENNGHMYITGAKGNVDKKFKESGLYNLITKIPNAKDIM